ncbi:DUF732 domain-containing protein [Rhodococcus aerolatus]
MSTAHRTARPTRLAAAALLGAAVLGVAGCGSSSATATSDPATSTTTVAPAVPSPSATTSTAPPTTAAPAPTSTAPTTSVDPSSLPTTPVATTSPTAVPAPGAPGAPPAVQTQAEANFAATLQQNGVQVTQDGGTQVNLGQAVCQELARGGDKQSILVSLLAIGQLAQANGSTSLDPQQYAQLVLTAAGNPANCN